MEKTSIGLSVRCSSESDVESGEALLEQLLAHSTLENEAKCIAPRLMQRFGALAAVLDAPQQELLSIEGMTVEAATLLLLVKRIWQKRAMQAMIVRNSDENQSRPELTNSTEEVPPPMGKPLLRAKNAHKMTDKSPALSQKESPQAASAPSIETKKYPALVKRAATLQEKPLPEAAAPSAGRTRKKQPQLQLELTASIPTQLHEESPEKQSVTEAPVKAEVKIVTPKPYIAKGMFSKAILKEGIELLPGFPDSDSLEEAREFLKKNMHFSAVSTRNRYASYVLNRLFPAGVADQALRRFAGKFAGRQELRDVCFYRFCKAEPLVLDVIEELVMPSIGVGRLNRERIKEYLAGRYGMSGYVKDCTQAIIEALTAAGIAKAEKGAITFGYREPLIPSFAFILHSEFSDPDMYGIAKLRENRGLRSMLWNPDRYLSALYELRNMGLISKVSEIDSFRQFTTQWAPDGLVDHLEAQR